MQQSPDITMTLYLDGEVLVPHTAIGADLHGAIRFALNCVKLRARHASRSA